MTHTATPETTTPGTATIEAAATEAATTEAATPETAAPELPTGPKRRRALALVWWTACALWAYFAMGELVTSAGYPEALGVVGVAAAFVAAGRRVRSSFAGMKAVTGGVLIVVTASVAGVILVPALLAAAIPTSKITFSALLLTISAALASLVFVRRRERDERPGALPKHALTRVLVWLLVVGFTGLALTLAARQ